MILDRRQHEISIPYKENEFSVLNDVPLLDIYKQNRFRNTGLKLHFYGISAGFGNWDQWWGPGIHNSLSLSNNAQGFYHYYIGTDGNQSVGKYVDLKDAYKSLDEALVHGGIHNNVKINLIRIESDLLKVTDVQKKLSNVSGIIIPGGFGKRGTEGKIACINYARTKKIPFLGICFGMQMAVIEFARNVLKIKNAGSSEFDKNCYPVIGLIEEWNKNGRKIKGTVKNLGGTMRLGLYPAKLQHNSLIKEIYKSGQIKERHRHRYEVNVNLRKKFETHGLNFSGMSPDNSLPEIVEIKNHPWFIGVQFHPEFKSRPLAPHPLFSSFIKASKNHK